jgi:hypothetical protein
MLPPFAEPVISTFPAAGDGTATVTEVSATASDALRTEPTKDRKIAQYLVHKAVPPQSGGPSFLPTNSPSFRQPGYQAV